MDRPIETTDLSPFKTNHRTFQLVFPEPSVATFAWSWPMKRGLATSVAVALIFAAACPVILHYVQTQDVFGWGATGFLVLFEVFFAAILVLMLMAHFHQRPLVFDKREGRLWRRGRPDPVLGDGAPLRDVEALQVCSAEVVGSEGSSYWVYELNVVMKRPPGARAPVMCHGNRKTLFADARQLAEFLDVPLWDHTKDENGPEAGD